MMTLILILVPFIVSILCFTGSLNKKERQFYLLSRRPESKKIVFLHRKKIIASLVEL